MRSRLALLAAVHVVAVSPASLAAQEPAPAAPRAELRVSAPVSPVTGLLVGAGVDLRAGWYARIGAGAMAGAVRRRGEWEARQQFDLTARFLFDPYAQQRVGLYGGAGLGLAHGEGANGRGVLLLLLGAEGPATGRTRPAIEVVIGGGVRVQAVLRGRRTTGR